MTDAAHLLSDVSGFAVALFAGEPPPDLPLDALAWSHSLLTCHLAWTLEAPFTLSLLNIS